MSTAQDNFMKIHYLGTGAAEGIPAIFCECPICKNARLKLGKEIRTRMQALINNELLIDFGPDTYLHSLRYSIDLSAIKYCLLTHAHEDHIYPHDIKCRKNNRAFLKTNTHSLNLYGSNGAFKLLNPFENGYVTKDGNVVFNLLTQLQIVEINGYRVIPIPAVHKTADPLVYAIQKGNKAILYCHDSDILGESSLQYLASQNLVFDLVSMDCTEGKKQINYHGHMNFERNKIMRKLLYDYGLVKETTIFLDFVLVETGPTAVPLILNLPHQKLQVLPYRIWLAIQ